MAHLKQECFNKLWKALAGLYTTEPHIRAFITKCDMKPEQVVLLGTGENMVFSFLGLAEKDGKVKEVIETALLPEEFPNHPVLMEVLASMNNGSAYVPLIIVRDIPSSTGDAVNVLLVYDNADNDMVRSLYKQLYPLQKHSQLISIFDMHNDLAAGSDRKEILDQKLRESQIVLLLLTPEFVGNDDNGCTDIGTQAFEMKKHVVPVLLKPCMWDRIKFLKNRLELPRREGDYKFVSDWPLKESPLLNIATGVANLAEHIKKNK